MFPTPVGMNRDEHGLYRETASVPHTRGDEPGNMKTSDSLKIVFPTPVGMNRCSRLIGRAMRGVPHTRGDEPLYFGDGHVIEIPSLSDGRFDEGGILTITYGSGEINIYTNGERILQQRVDDKRTATGDRPMLGGETSFAGRSLPHRQLRSSDELYGIHIASSLPHRQLRRGAAHLCSSLSRSLPHRQLRRGLTLVELKTRGSLPHRQLRRS